MPNVFLPKANGVLDDHFDCWFMTYEEPPQSMPEGFESVFDLSLNEEWLDAPSITDYEKFKI